MQNNSKRFWNIIKWGSGCSLEQPQNNVSQEDWVNYFAPQYASAVTSTPNVDSLSVYFITDIFELEDVTQAFGLVAGGKAPGPDGVPADVFLYDKENWGAYILLLANSLARGGPIPDSWKDADIIPVFKKGDRSLPGNYRPISLIDTVQKVVGRMILSKVQKWMDDENILSSFQAGFRESISTIDQVFRFNLLYWKTVTLKKGSMYAAFVDLRAAFDLVPRSRLWATLRELGLLPELVTLLERLHEGNRARIRWGKQGETTCHFPVERGVRQGCTLAPTLFSLYINGIVDRLSPINTDALTLAGVKVPILMFADDTLIISKTPSGLQRALQTFEVFCLDRGLEVNVSKTKFMALNPHKLFKGSIMLNNLPLEKVRVFPYLGLNIQRDLKWKQHIDLVALKHRQLTGALIAEHARSLTKPISPALQVYGMKVMTSALYGAEIWGFDKISNLETQENKFFRSITSLPISTPIVPLRYDLGRNSISAIAKLRPILYWQRLWTTPALLPYAEGFVDVIESDSFPKIRWLQDLRKSLDELGLLELWENPRAAIFPSKKIIKKKFWERALFVIFNKVGSASLTGKFLDIKFLPSYELFWDIVAKPLDRKLYFQLRVGSLPIGSFTSR